MQVLCHDDGIAAEVYTAPYAQYAQEIISEKSGLYRSSPDIIFIILEPENLLGDFYYFPYRMPPDDRKAFIEQKYAELEGLLMLLKSRTKAKIVLGNLALPTYSSRGIAEDKQEWGVKQAVQQFNIMLRSLCLNDPQLFLFDINQFYLQVGCDVACDPRMIYRGDMKISPLALVRLASTLMGYVFPLLALTRKCIVLDLDNTLWGGVIGEDGMDNIKLGPDKLGKPFLDFQKRLLELFERGIILAINSKNNYDDAIAVIRNHKYMLLREDMFAAMRINWDDKAKNMVALAEELNIGVDSFVFIDDDKSNRALIKEFLPEVKVLDLPADPCLYAKALEELHVFNLFSITDSDTNRGKQYVDQKKRSELEKTMPDLASFIKKLEIKIRIGNGDSAVIPRVAQLTKKTNQFNLTTQRYEEEDIAVFMESADYLVKYIDVEDRFGEYGLTGTAVVKRHDAEGYWEVDTFLLSCRILGKGIEFAFMQDILDEAAKASIKQVRATFIPTKKNAPAAGFLSECGFVNDTVEGEIQHYHVDIGKEKKREKMMEVKLWKH